MSDQTLYQLPLFLVLKMTPNSPRVKGCGVRVKKNHGHHKFRVGIAQESSCFKYHHPLSCCTVMTATRRAAWQAYSISRSSSHSNALASSRYCTILQRDQIRHATSSRIPAARPSRISPRPIQHNRRTGPSHTQREIEPNKEVTADCEDGKRTKFETTSVAGENESDSNALTAEPKEENKEIINPSDIESILGQDTLVVTRQVEMMNIFLGFEQSNKYAINSAQGEPVGYLAESEKGIMGGSIQRQVLRTHRPFEAQILDTNGNILLIIKRPFTFINSKISIYTLDPITKDEVLVGQVHQIFHVIRRKYELFINRGGEKGHEELEQFADIDEGLWAWDFMLKDDQGRPLGAISRNFRGSVEQSTSQPVHR